MKSNTIHEWLEIVGIAAVVASLIFVGLQLKQSQDIAIAAQYQARHDSNADLLFATLQSESGLRAWGRVLSEDLEANPNLSDTFKSWVRDQPVEELAAHEIRGVAMLKIYDNIYFQYQNGFMAEEMWQAMRVQMKRQLANPDLWMRGVYEYDQRVWRESFQELVNQVLSEI